MANLGNLDFDMTLRNEEFLKKLKESQKISEETVKYIENAMQINAKGSIKDEISSERLAREKLKTTKEQLAVDRAREANASNSLMAEEKLLAVSQEVANKKLVAEGILSRTQGARLRDEAKANYENTRAAETSATAEQRRANIAAETANKRLRAEEIAARADNARMKTEAQIETQKQRTAAISDRNARAEESHALKMQNLRKRLNDETLKNNNHLSSQSRILQQLRTVAGTYLSIWTAGRFIKQLTEISGEFELQEKSLAAIIQNAERAHTIFTQIKHLSVESPFQFKEMMSYAKQLSAFSVPTNELFETTKRLADVSAGLGVEMYRIILAFGQVRSAAVLRGQELRQFTEAGIPLVQELANKFSELEGRVVTTGEVFEKISKRLVPFEMIRDIFTDMTDEGGKFYRMQEIQAQTLTGKINNLKDAFDIMMSEIGSSNEEKLKGGVDTIRRLFDNWEKVADVLKTVVVAYGTYKAVTTGYWMISNIALVATQVGQWVQMARALGVATANAVAFGRGVNMTKVAVSALGGVLSIVAALGMHFYTAAQNANKLNRELDEVKNNAVNSYFYDRGTFQKLIDKLSQAESGTQEYRDAIRQLNRQYSEFLPYQLKVTDSFDAISEAALAAKDSMLQAARASAQARGEEKILDDFTKKTSGIYTKAVKEISKKPSFLAYAILPDKAATERLVSDLFTSIREGSLKNADKLGIREALLSELAYVSKHKKETIAGLPQFEAALGLLVNYKNETESLEENIDNLSSGLNAVFGGTSDIQKELNAETEKYKSLLNELKAQQLSDESYKEKAKELELQHNKDLLAIFEARGRANSQEAQEIRSYIEDVENLGVVWRKVATERSEANDFSRMFSPTNEEHNLFDYIGRLRGEYKALNEELNEYETLSPFLVNEEDLARTKNQVEFLKNLFTLFNIKIEPPKPTNSEEEYKRRLKEQAKAIEDAIKKHLDEIDDEIKDYAKRFDFYKYFFERSGDIDQSVKLSFGVDFEGTPSLIEFIKAKLEEVGEGKLNLDLDFTVDKFNDLFKEVPDKSIFHEETIKYIRELFNQLVDLTREESKVTDELFDKYLGYTKLKEKVDREYYAKRQKFIENGADTDVLDNLKKEWQDILNDLALKFTEKDLEFNAFVNSLAKKSIEELGKLLLQIDLEMSKLIEEGGDAEVILALRAKVVKLEEELRKNSGKPEEEEKEEDPYKSWKQLETVLNRVGRELEEISGSVDGTLGKLLKLASTMAVSTTRIVNGIVKLNELSSQTIEDTATGATLAMAKIEKASVILTIISAAIKILNTDLIELFGISERQEFLNELEEDRNRLIREYNQLLIERIALEDNLFGGNELQNVVNVMKAYEEASKILDEILNKNTTVRDFYAKGKYVDFESTARDALRIKTKDRNWFGKNILGLVEEYENLEEYIKRTTGLDLFNKDGLLNLDVAKEVSQWEKLDKFTKEYLADLISAQETWEEMQGRIEQMIDTTFGKLGDSLTNALVDSFINGSLAAEDFRKDVETVLEDVGRQIVRMLFVQEFIDTYKEKLKGIYEGYAKDNDEAKFAKSLMDSTAEFFNSMQKGTAESEAFLKMLKEEAAKRGFSLYGKDSATQTQSQLSRQITGLSEEKGDLLGSYLNSIRDHTSRILIMMEANKELYPTINTTLANCQARLVEISNNTLRNADAADEIKIILNSVVAGTKSITVK